MLHRNKATLPLKPSLSNPKKSTGEETMDHASEVSLASLGLSGEAYPRAAALARIDELVGQQVYVVALEIFEMTPDGALEYTYEGWEAHDYDGDGEAANMRRGSAEARDFVEAWEGDGSGTPLFRFTLRSKDVYLGAQE